MGTPVHLCTKDRNMWCKVLAFAAFISISYAGDINRQSIVYHEETPEVFYCPQEKPVSLEGMIVKARPLKALCEHQGRALPENYKSDCWNDVDETEFACSEKERILLKLKPPGSENAIDSDRLIPKNRRGDYKLKKLDASGTRFEDADDDDYLYRQALEQEENRKRTPKTDF